MLNDVVVMMTGFLNIYIQYDIIYDVCLFFFLMIRRPPRSTRTDTLFPYTTRFRADDRAQPARLVPGAARAGARLLPRDFLRIAHGRASARHPRRRTAAPGPEWPLPCLGRADRQADRKSVV